MCLCAKERGGRNGAPQRTGFGAELLLKTLPSALKAEVAWEGDPGGLRGVIALPLPAIDEPQARSASAT